ncbi:MAG TPA: universal stress protein [Steroidobacteraceae bacterium]|nr:universal stress protein [Steroidobacteraceae bacterium]
MTATTTRRILVAVKDPGAAPSAPVLKAAQLARALRAELVLFHAIELPLSADAYPGNERQLGDDENSIRRDYLRALEAQAAPLRAQGIAVCVAAEWDFPASEALLRHAHAVGADLVAMGQARGGSAHTTVREVMRLSPFPVLLVRPAAPYASPSLIAALDLMRRGPGARALNRMICLQAQTLSTALSGSWNVVCAARSPFTGTARAAIATVLPTSGSPPRSVRFKTASASRAILQSAASTRAQIIVLGAVEVPELLRLLTGSTLRRVVADSSHDILVVKLPGLGVHFSTRVRGPRMISVGMPPAVWYGRVMGGL